MIREGQIVVKLCHVVPKVRLNLITSQVERFNIKLNVSPKAGMALTLHLLAEVSL